MKKKTRKKAVRIVKLKVENKRNWLIPVRFKNKVEVYLPQINRFFSAKEAKIGLKVGLASILSVLLIYNIALAWGVNVEKDKRETEKAKEQADTVKKIENNITFWEEVVREKPNYRDGFLELTTLNYKLGRMATARDYWKKAKDLDPNNPTTKQLENILQINYNNLGNPM